MMVLSPTFSIRMTMGDIRITRTMSTAKLATIIGRFACIIVQAAVLPPIAVLNEIRNVMFGGTLQEIISPVLFPKRSLATYFIFTVQVGGGMVFATRTAPHVA